MDQSSALAPNAGVGAVSPIQSGAPMATLQQPPMHPHNFTWKRNHSSVNAVSVGFIAAAALISVFLIVAIFETLLRRPSLRPISIPDRNSNDSDSEAPASEFSVKREDAITGGTAGLSVLMPGQTHPTFVALPVPVQCSNEETSLVTHDYGKTGDARPSTPTCSTSPIPVPSSHEDIPWPTYEHDKTGSCSFDVECVLNR